MDSNTNAPHLISRYSRAQALADGVLVDLSELAREAGFRCPVAATAAVWALIETIPTPLQHWQDVMGRCWDVLYMASLAVRRQREASHCTFRLILATPENTPDPFDADALEPEQQLVTFKIVAGPGDEGELVLTLLMPGED